MSQPIPAIFENGVFRPIVPVELPEGTAATVTPPPPSPPSKHLPGFGLLSPDGPNAQEGEEFDRAIAEIMSWRRLPRPDPCEETPEA